jgi:hypothetical protein
MDEKYLTIKYNLDLWDKYVVYNIKHKNPEPSIEKIKYINSIKRSIDAIRHKIMMYERFSSESKLQEVKSLYEDLFSKLEQSISFEY